MAGGRAGHASYSEDFDFDLLLLVVPVFGESAEVLGFGVSDLELSELEAVLVSLLAPDL